MLANKVWNPIHEDRFHLVYSDGSDEYVCGDENAAIDHAQETCQEKQCSVEIFNLTTNKKLC